MEFNKSTWDLMESIAKLENDWNENGPKEISCFVFNEVCNLIFRLTNMEKQIYNVSPGANGEIAILLKGDSGELELIIYPEISVYVKYPILEIPSQGVLTNLEELIDWLK